jgi:hypothetical protein
MRTIPGTMETRLEACNSRSPRNEGFLPARAAVCLRGTDDLFVITGRGRTSSLPDIEAQDSVVERREFPTERSSHAGRTFSLLAAGAKISLGLIFAS